MVLSSWICKAECERTPQERGCLSKRIYCSCSAFLCKMAAALSTTGQKEVNKPSTQKASKSHNVWLDQYCCFLSKIDREYVWKRTGMRRLIVGQCTTRSEVLTRWQILSKTGHLRRKTVLGLVKQALKLLFAFNFCVGWVSLWNRTNVNCVFWKFRFFSFKL